MRKGASFPISTKADFQIFEENKPQSIRYFTRERSQPVVVGFLIDLSSASSIHWKNFQDAAEELIQNLLTGDKKYSGYLITYGQNAELAVNTNHDPEPLVEKLRKLKPGGGSALYDAIYLACTSRKLVKGEPIEPRRVIVIIGDGHDNASKHSLEASDRAGAAESGHGLLHQHLGLRLHQPSEREPGQLAQEPAAASCIRSATCIKTPTVTCRILPTMATTNSPSALGAFVRRGQ